jgi:hypothetical protein
MRLERVTRRIARIGKRWLADIASGKGSGKQARMPSAETVAKAIGVGGRITRVLK